MSVPRPRVARKLLVASVGIAAISYVACNVNETSGNLAAPPPPDASNVDVIIGSGNLLPPPPPDGGADADASDGSSDAPHDSPSDATDGGD